ncbi:MAG TPA: ISC system 2Fe-2S type ferredoxin [Burkholderiaceae bacterium]|nr:ISC system 2Fe-2S type ferredoxin [Burkholderiaceae bacterium]
MPTVTVLPHESLAPSGASFEAVPGKSLCQQLVDHGIDIEHACGMVAACTTCHVIVREGFARLPPSEEKEDDMLDKAWGLTATSRLSCQVDPVATDLTIELPKYTINHARE